MVDLLTNPFFIKKEKTYNKFIIYNEIYFDGGQKLNKKIMNNFRLFGGKEIKNASDYVRDYIKKFPETKIIVGTDSEQYKTYTNYVTVIGMMRPRKGVHIIYKTEKLGKIKDIFTRLWNEVECSRLVADSLEETINTNPEKKMVTVHIDINNKKNEKSNIVHDSAVGYLKGLGYPVEAKPDGWVATKAADWLC